MDVGNWKCRDSDWMRNERMCKCARQQKCWFPEELMAIVECSEREMNKINNLRLLI